ncbi:VanZ family protein, partial [Limnohabitans sp. Rim8]|uniref:VanZ family protein n=1 Tax=Limnohabitans sp. Rim8 TaxID=1100718 RepID=UPI002612FFAE
ALFFGALLGVTVLALLPAEQLTLPLFSVWDKAQHALAFAALSVLGFMAFKERRIIVVLALSSYGILIELAQMGTGWRSGEWSDALADLLGILLVWALARLTRV